MAFQGLPIFSTFILVLALIFPLISANLEANSSHSHHMKPPPFSFLRHLQGCHEGDKLQGVHDLKKYLERFGYLSYAHMNAHHLDDDIFDDQLELAIKTYQLNYNLEATGVLDATTVAQMSQPRCGVADIVNGTTRMRSGRKKHHHGHGNFHTVSHFTFFPGSPRWPPSKSHLTYAFLPTVPANAMAPVTRAFNNWAGKTHFTFSRAPTHQNADITISFERGSHGDGAPFDGAGGVIAHAFAPTNGRFHYDADERYAVGTVPGAYDLETVALHEIGHLLGLGHSSVRGAIMWSGISTGETKGLHADDIAGIRALYNA